MLIPFSITTPTTKLTYRLYESEHSKESKTLVLLHGAGVGGEITWSDFLPYLTHWQRIVIPDLKGMGDSYSLSQEKSHSYRSTTQSIFVHNRALPERIGIHSQD